MKVLIVDDNVAVCDALDLVLSLHDIESVQCHMPEQALRCIDEHDIGLVIQDMNFTADTTSGEEGRALFFQIRERYVDLPIILLTAWTHLEMAVELVRAGAADYLSKPWDDDKLIVSVKNLLELHELRVEHDALSASRRKTQTALARFDLCGLVYKSVEMERLLEVAVQVAEADVPVFISGPNGAGKEKVAEIIQANSSRKDAAFIKVNAGALPAELIEAELFGAEAGAYTGANKARIGRFEAADGGTLFLDEIGNLPLAGQMKLLRTLQTGEFERLGSSQTRKVDVRVISATNVDLPQAISAGSFRQDLYYRLNVIELMLPPLCDRPADIMPLVNHFSGGRRVDPASVRSLQRYPWPGNVRELENAVKRATLLAKGDMLTSEDFALDLTAPVSTPPHEPSLEDMKQALEDAQGVVARAAKSLGLSRQAFYRRMDKYGLARA